jgi:hypothetical protein
MGGFKCGNSCILFIPITGFNTSNGVPGKIRIATSPHRTYGAAEGLGRAEIVVATANLLAYVKDGPEMGRVGQRRPQPALALLLHGVSICFNTF